LDLGDCGTARSVLAADYSAHAANLQRPNLTSVDSNEMLVRASAS